MVEEDVCVLQVIFANTFFFCLHSDVPVIREGKYLRKFCMFAGWINFYLWTWLYSPQSCCKFMLSSEKTLLRASYLTDIKKFHLYQ